MIYSHITEITSENTGPKNLWFNINMYFYAVIQYPASKDYNH